MYPILSKIGSFNKKKKKNMQNSTMHFNIFFPKHFYIKGMSCIMVTLSGQLHQKKLHQILCVT